MKFSKAFSVLALFAIVSLCDTAVAETVHQTVPSAKIYTGSGDNAIDKGVMEVKKVDGATNDQVARIKGNMNQWGYVNCWFGVPAPAGKSIVRIRVFNDGQKTAKYLLYIRTSGGQHMIGPLAIPADAKENTFVDVDVPVNASDEWSGLVIKKADKSDLPSPWIDTVSVVLPD